jgi:hypothetical protein
VGKMQSFEKVKVGDKYGNHWALKGLNNELIILIGNMSQLKGFNAFGNKYDLL